MSDPQQPQNWQWPQQGGQPEPGAQQWPSSRGRLRDIQAGVYGSPTAAWLAIAGGNWGFCLVKSPLAIETALTTAGYMNVKSYTAGPKGGSLACGQKAANNTTLLHCAWIDKSTAGDVVFAGGAASDLADAAAKTNQVRAAIEH